MVSRYLARFLGRSALSLPVLHPVSDLHMQLNPGKARLRLAHPGGTPLSADLHIGGRELDAQLLNASGRLPVGPLISTSSVSGDPIMPTLPFLHSVSSGVVSGSDWRATCVQLAPLWTTKFTSAFRACRGLLDKIHSPRPLAFDVDLGRFPVSSFCPSRSASDLHSDPLHHSWPGLCMQEFVTDLVDHYRTASSVPAGSGCLSVAPRPPRQLQRRALMSVGGPDAVESPALCWTPMACRATPWLWILRLVTLLVCPLPLH